MALYLYRGRNAAGKLVKGTLEAQSEEGVANTLLREKISPVFIGLKPKKEDVLKSISDTLKLGYPTLKDLVILSRQLYSLIRASIPIVRSIRVVADGTKNQRLKDALLDVVVSVEAGQSLAVSFNKHPLIFPTLMVYLVNIGENSGSLEEIFKQLSIHFERELDMRKKAKTVIRYPIFVFCVIGLAILVINFFVVPAFANFFKTFNAELPIYTRMLIASSEIMIGYWHIGLLIIFALIFVIKSYLKTYKGHFNWDKWKLKLPLFGNILKETMLSRFARAFALCVRTGVPLLESIQLISNATDNLYVSEKILGMRSSIEKGETLTIAATKTQLFTPLILQMFAIGEESGEIDRLLDEVALSYEEDVDYDIKKMADAIEPILIVIIGAFVLLLALAVYLPMWNLGQVMMKK